MTGGPDLPTAAAVGAGAALGAVARHLVAVAALAWLGSGFPWGTLAVNLLGSVLIGWIAARSASRPGASLFRPFMMAGFCGGFTTLSIFSLETLHLAAAGRVEAAATYVAISVPLWLAGAWIGWRIGAAAPRCD